MKDKDKDFFEKCMRTIEETPKKQLLAIYAANVPMGKICEVGKIVVNRCLEKEYFINLRKLQLLLYLIYKEHLARTKEDIFIDNFELKSFGIFNAKVDKKLRIGVIEFKSYLKEYICLKNEEEITVNYIIEKYGEFNSIKLNKICKKNNNII